MNRRLARAADGRGRGAGHFSSGMNAGLAVPVAMLIGPLMTATFARDI